MRKVFKIVLKILPFIITGVMFIAVLTSGKDLTVETVLSYMPDNLYVATLFILVMYILKSLSVIFPIIVLQVATGIIFPIWSALIINTVGTALAYTIPYLTGRFSGRAAIEKILLKYPKVQEIIDMQRKNSWFPSFILRAVSCLPADIISLCLGSLKAPYIPYIIASVVGTLPGLVPATIAGTKILDPTSPVFITSAILAVVISALSILIYALITRKKCV